MIRRRISGWSAAAIVLALLAAACGGTAATPSPSTGTSAGTSTGPGQTAAPTAQTNPDGTTTDADGFVRFPGEASRPDQAHYYITADLCGQFTQRFMEGLRGKTFALVQPYPNPNAVECDYYLTAPSATNKAGDYIMLNLSFLSVANQKQGLVALGRTPTADPSIPMDNWVVRAEDGHLVSIYFLLGTDKFLTLDRNSGTSTTEAELIGYAAKLGEKMKDMR